MKRSVEEAQQLKEREEKNKKHTDAIYKEIVKLFDFEIPFGDWRYYPDPDKFPKELSSHLNAYGALDTAINAKELCDNSNADLKKAIARALFLFGLWQPRGIRGMLADRKKHDQN